MVPQGLALGVSAHIHERLAENSPVACSCLEWCLRGYHKDQLGDLKIAR